MDFVSNPHRRFNALTGEWVLVSPHRTKRPWQGKVEVPTKDDRPSYDPTCYLCPGNERAGGVHNPSYTSTFVFNNDFSAILPNVNKSTFQDGELFRAESEQGICRVICFSPRHDLTIPRMSNAEIRNVIDVWADQYKELGSVDYINNVQIFENRGEIMGCSNPHPHGQIWSSQGIPYLIQLEQEKQTAYHRNHGSCLICDYVKKEREIGERLVVENERFLALVPFWAVWPFETMIVPLNHKSSLLDFDNDDKDALADIMRRLGIRYDNLFSTSFPYSMGVHQSPTDGNAHPEWHVHLHYLPPLLRSATIKKFMVGYELLAMPQRDITPEQSAERLRGLSEVHYLDKAQPELLASAR